MEKGCDRKMGGGRELKEKESIERDGRGDVGGWLLGQLTNVIPRPPGCRDCEVCHNVACSSCQRDCMVCTQETGTEEDIKETNNAAVQPKKKERKIKQQTNNHKRKTNTQTKKG